MGLVAGDRLGAYEIIALIGAGGMGEVYRARDTRLERPVAIKILPESLASDPLFRERFDREAKAIAGLNHPHICTLHDIGRQDGTDYLVLEYLEGKTLAARLDKGALPVEQALAIAIQIADALDKAHRAGIVHRDLKPGNIMLTKSGAKLLDFGLAKGGAPVAAGAGLSMLPTTPLNLTAQGTILGTLHYMAPEQVEGQEADARTDIFAFGVVLYEMLTGRKAFVGKSPASVMGAILKEQPPSIATLQPLTPPALDHVVMTCLVKDPDERWQTAADLKRELQWAASADPTRPALPAAKQKRSVSVAVAALAVWAIAATALGFWTLVTRTPALPEQPVVRFEVPVPPGTSFGEAPTSPRQSLSPDGRYLAYSAGPVGARQTIWVRRLDQTEARALPGTTGGSEPFWSPDSRYIAFYAEGRLKRIPIDGGLVETLADTPINHRGTWNRAGDILFSEPTSRGIARVSATGGTPKVVTTLNVEERETLHRQPEFLPDGDHFLFLTAPDNVVKVASITAPEVKPLGLRDVSEVRYAPPGYLLYITQRTLVARRFDAEQLEFRGEPTTITTSVRSDFLGRAAFSVSASGALTYRQDLGRTMQVGWFTREGKLLEEPVLPGDYRSVEPSPDGQRLVLKRGDLAAYNILTLVDARRRTDVRLTMHPSNSLSAHWSPDGHAVVFASNRDGGGLYIKRVDTTLDEERLLATKGAVAPTDWSADGQLIVYEQDDPKNSSDIWVLSLSGGKREPRPFLRTPSAEGEATLSSDGRWMAYTSDEPGQFQVYVQPYPATGNKWQVSSGGGTQPRWRRDGRELFFIDASGAVMATSIAVTGTKVDVGQPQRLFETRMDTASPANATVQNMRWAVSADGQRFLVLNKVGTTNAEPLVVVLNWLEELKRLVPTK